MKFTAESIKGLRLKPAEDDVTKSDDTIPGWLFRMRRTRKGVNCYWQFDYPVGAAVSIGGRKRRRRRKLIFGRYPAMKVPQAREKAEKLHAETMLGTDPQQMKVENRARSADTYEACVRLYLAWLRAEKKLAPRTLAEIERHLVRNLEALNPIRIDQIDRRRLTIEISVIARVSGQVQANRTATSVRTFFRWCLGEGLVALNPAIDLNRYGEEARTRTLPPAEFALVAAVLPPSDYRDILWLLYLSGQRAAEIGSLRWSEVDLENALITLPPPRVKNRRKHSFPLSTPALAILQRRWDARSDDRDLVFGRGQGDKGFSGWSHAKARLDAKLDLEPWCVHDLRRSFSTGLGDIGIPPHIIEMSINHQSGAKAGVSGR
jgi:integrase